MVRKPRPPTKRQAAFLAEMAARGGLVGRFRESDGLQHYRFLDGRPAHGVTVFSCIRRGFIIANNDELFPGFTQTWRRP